MTEEQAAELLMDMATIIEQQQIIYGGVFVAIGVIIAFALALIVAEVLRAL